MSDDRAGPAVAAKPRVLFVDDEPRILDGLRRSLRTRRGEWDMAFATGGEQALKLVAEAPFDVVVSDMKMPGVDGAELLTRLSVRHPEVARVVLSGHIEPEAVVKVAVSGHRFLTKPSDVGGLVGVIDQLLVHTSGGHRGAARRIAGGVRSVPPVPDHADDTAALLREEADLDTAVRAGTHDIGLAAKLLQLSNSRFFGVPPRNSSVESVVTAMGVPMIRAVATAGQQPWPTPGSPGSGDLLGRTWHHALATARLAQQLASPANRPYAHAAALLQDIGTLVCLATGHDRDGVPFRDVGVELLHLWGVPAPVVTAVAQRDLEHRPDPSGLGVAAALRTAHLLIQQTSCADPSVGTHEAELAALLAHPQLQARGVNWHQAADEAARHCAPDACASRP